MSDADADHDEHDTGGSNGSTDDTDAVATVVSRVRDRVDPDAEERAHLERVADRLLERATAAATDLCAAADAMQVGSSARGTWISGDRDIDIFVRFPPDLDRETLEQYGLEVGHATVPNGHEEYAEHPYVKGEIEGFDVDVVPCFRLESATEIQSAVDRTPFHDQYLQSRLDDELAADVRLTKGFLKGIGAYGSDLRTRGFSGYLTELLVCEYSGFRPLLEAAVDWQPPVELDPEGHGHTTAASSPGGDNAGNAKLPFDDPLVVIDPTDPERNVAAVCSAENVARLQHYAREFLETPEIDYFDPRNPEPLSEPELHSHLERRGTTPVAVRFDAPDLVDDQLYPQLYKSLSGISQGLDDRGFDVFRGTTFTDETAVIFVELAVSERPAIERHRGPPVHVQGHAKGFYDAYADDPDTYGPFLEGSRYVAEREREFRTAREFLESDRLFDVGLGTHVESTLEDDYEVLVDDEIIALLEEFGTELRRYLEPRP